MKALLSMVGLALLGSVALLAERAPSHAPVASDCAGGAFPTAYDRLIHRAERKHYPVELIAERPCAWKAQLAQESSLNPATCGQANSAGAKCLAQILPQTAERIEAATGLRGTRSDARAAIYGGAWLMRSEWDFWSEPRPVDCRWELALVSYHGGAGWPLRAQRAARREGSLGLCWKDVEPYMTGVGVAKTNVVLHQKYIDGIETKREGMVR